MNAPILPPAPCRRVTIILPDALLDALDTAVVMTGAESRSALVRDFAELGLALLHNPEEALEPLVDGMIANLEAVAALDDEAADRQLTLG